MIRLTSKITLLCASAIVAASTLRRDTLDCASDVLRVSWVNGTNLINATSILAGGLTIDGTTNTIPFCRVFANAPYPANNTVVYEVWLPNAADYNGRFLAVGNGGMAGIIDEYALLVNLNSGYAVAGGDSGHRAADNADGEPAPGVHLPYLHDTQQVLAWIHSSIAYFTPPAKNLVEQFYGTEASHSYYKGCSTGGGQGFALAQFHPELFDGIVAGSPGNWYSHLLLAFLWGLQLNQTLTSSGGTLTQDDLDVIGAAVISQCDKLDGVEDGLIEDPLKCDFNITTLSCSSRFNSTSCLNDLQIEALKGIYDGPRDARTGESLYPGFSVGSEVAWLLQLGSLATNYTIPILQNLVFDNLTWDATTFNWGSDVTSVNQKAGKLIDEISPDLSAFHARGGKLIVTQGWSDPYTAATWPIEHLHQVEAGFGGNVSDWYEVFMVPGGGHCGNNALYPQAPTNWHSLEKLVRWVEVGETPKDMLSSDPLDGSNRTRKLCPWPSTARYTGGSVDDWTSYSCNVDGPTVVTQMTGHRPRSRVR